MTLIMYYIALKKLWAEYHVFKPILVCTCSAGRQIVEHGTRNRLIQNLMGLNDSYDSIRDQILLLDPIPSVTKAYSMVLRVEKQIETNVQFEETIEQSAHLVRSGYNTNSRFQSQFERAKKGDKYYSYCKETNHTKDNCLNLWFILISGKGKKSQKLVKNPQYVGANLLASNPLDFCDSNGEKEIKP